MAHNQHGVLRVALAMNQDHTSSSNTAELVAFIRAELGMTQAGFGAMTRKCAGTISIYEHGERRPPAIFWHDIIDAAPECGLRFNDIANAFGYRPIESVNPFAYGTIHHFFVGVRVMSGLTRTGFAKTLDLSAHQITEIEHRTKPHPDIVRIVADRFLRPKYCYADVVRRFRTLRPTRTDLELRRRFRLLRQTTTTSEQRDSLRTALINEHIDVAKSHARYVARRSKSRDAAEAWTVALVKAVVGYHHQYGDFIPYLRKWVFGQVKTHIMRECQSGTARELQGELGKFCQAQDHLRQQLRREPTTNEVATRLDLPPAKVINIRRALAARHAKSLDSCADLQATPAAPLPTLSEESQRLLAKLTPSLRSVVELRFLQGLDINEIAERLDIDPETAESWLRLALKHLREHAEAA